MTEFMVEHRVKWREGESLLTIVNNVKRAFWLSFAVFPSTIKMNRTLQRIIVKDNGGGYVSIVSSCAIVVDSTLPEDTLVFQAQLILGEGERYVQLVPIFRDGPLPLGEAIGFQMVPKPIRQPLID